MSSCNLKEAQLQGDSNLRLSSKTLTLTSVDLWPNFDKCFSIDKRNQGVNGE